MKVGYTKSEKTNVISDTIAAVSAGQCSINQLTSSLLTNCATKIKMHLLPKHKQAQGTDKGRDQHPHITCLSEDESSQPIDCTIDLKNLQPAE